jgi:tetratricopeptide (TPR) repeat protein
MPEHMTEAHLVEPLVKRAVTQGDWTAALAAWRGAAGADSNATDDADVFLRLARALRDSGEPALAAATLEQTVERFPAHAASVKAVAELAAARADWTLAAARWQQVADMAVGEDRLHALRQCALACERNGRAEDAEAVLATAVRESPRSAQLRREHARLAVRRSQWLAAAERWQVLCEGWHGPGAPRHRDHAALINALRRAGRLNEAESAHARAVAAFQDAPEIAAAGAEVAAAANHWVLAQTRWRRMLELSGDAAPARASISLARCQREAGDLVGAEATLASAREQHPADPLLCGEHALLATLRGDPAAARERWRQALAASGAEPAAGVVGVLLQSVRASTERASGEDLLSMAIARFGPQAPLLRESARLATRAKVWIDAAERWQRYLDAYPDRATADEYRRARAALSARGEHEAAARLLSKALAAFPKDSGLADDVIQTAVAHRCSAGFGLGGQGTERPDARPAARSSTGSQPTVSDICAAFWEIESTLGLVDWQIRGVYPWRLVRIGLYYAITQGVGIFDVPHPNLGRLARPDEQRGAEAVRLWQSVSRGPGASPRPEHAILMATRLLNGAEPYTEALRTELGSRALLIDRTSGDRSLPGALDLRALLPHFQKHLRQPQDGALGYVDQLLCADIRERFWELLGVDAGDLVQRCRQALLTFRSVQRGMTPVFEQNPVRTLFLTNGYVPASCAVLAAATDAGADSVELQHGFISHLHLGYSWPGTDRVPYMADKLWCFGQYWADAAPLPRAVCTRVIGAPYVRALARAVAVDRERGLVIFTSQGVIGKLLLRVAVETARLRPDRKFLFRLHPSEEIEDYERPLAELGERPSNFRLSHREPVIFELLARADVQVGAFSTTLLEGMYLGTRTVVVDLPGSEYMVPVVDRGDALRVRNAAELAQRLDDAPAAADPSYYYADPVAPLVPD